MLHLLVSVILGQAQPSAPLLDLPLTAAPLQAPKVLVDLKLKPVTISQIEYEPAKETIRVFRYTFKGDFTNLLTKWQAALEKEGWTYQKRGEDGVAAFERTKSKSPLIRQAFLVRRAKISRDESMRAATKIDARAKGWIGISYNEIVPLGYWDKKR
ncbi:MAG TPA: hypothetical protein PLL78_05715 [Fimbriimonadaceae bacterium]|nr:hypothetical protein [Fimbriimonadaceae bacterium]HRJ96165.1 hypothetical protein [Fimbriimonadaceae bacterium]